MAKRTEKKKKLRVDLLLAELRREIVEGTLKPKEKIFEEALAKRFSISRSPIREAFRVLESEGLVRIIPRRGVYVSDIDVEDIERINDIRIVLEGLGARLACRNMTDEGLGRLKVIAAQMSDAGRNKEYQLYFKLNKEFHETINSFTDNIYLKKILSTLAELSHRYRFYVSYFTLSNQIKQLDKFHGDLVEAFRSKNEKQAEKVRRRQVTKSSDILKRTISQTLKSSIGGKK
ncbi:MAG: GntR family transcriptional regulator [Thermodesulfobacteriota bacterium]